MVCCLAAQWTSLGVFPTTRIFVTMHPDRQRKIRALFDEYIEMYAARDDRLTTRFSQNFSGYPGSGTG
jgi:hypothetical protein